MPVPSLREIAKRACINNIRSIDDVGECDYSVIRDVLIKVPDPAQLHAIEKASPQICQTESEENDGEIWLALIRRYVPQADKKLANMGNPRLNYRIYKKLTKQDEEQMQKDKEELKAKFQNYKIEREKNTSRLVDESELPTKHQKKSRMYGGTTQVTGATSAIQKIRKETKDAKLFGAHAKPLVPPRQSLGSTVQASRGLSTNRARGLIGTALTPAAPLRSVGFMSEDELQRRRQERAARETKRLNDSHPAGDFASSTKTKPGVKRNADGNSKGSSVSATEDDNLFDEPVSTAFSAPIKLRKIGRGAFKSTQEKKAVASLQEGDSEPSHTKPSPLRTPLAATSSTPLSSTAHSSPVQRRTVPVEAAAEKQDQPRKIFRKTRQVNPFMKPKPVAR